MAITYVGVDGEGKGRNPHLYTLLAAATEDGRTAYVEHPKGIKTVECLEFLVSLSEWAPVLFTFAFMYDLTKIFEDLPNEAIYKLLRPELRLHVKPTKFSSRKLISWKGFRIDYHASCTVIRKGRRMVTLWDVFKFYQSSFIKTLDKWDVGTTEEREFITKMKGLRADDEFYTDRNRVRDYCFLECRLLGGLVHKLDDAHKKAGIKLKDYYGAGSTATGVLFKMDIERKRRPPPPHIMHAVMRAFFGGRFENSIIGDVLGPLYSFDISSAYPYQLFRMPCLEHGSWDFTISESEAKDARIALIWWSLGPGNYDSPWGPFPFRTMKGTILFPVSGGSGWTWQEEFFQARSMFPNVIFNGAYVFHSTCSCRPFELIPQLYRERIRIGKKGPGIVIKLGVNACYGKIVQSVGKPRFANWIWGGMITSNTRALLLKALASHRDYSNMIITATDGIVSREDIELPIPEDTGTFDLKEPLGGWERDVLEAGMFAAKPGVNFPLDLSKADIDDVKGRGFGRKALFDNANLIREHWKKHGLHMECPDCTGTGCKECKRTGFIKSRIQLPDIGRFYGAKTSVWKAGEKEYKRADCYGTWYSYEPFLSFDPSPKRKGVRPDGTLIPHVLPPNAMSSAYKSDFGDQYATLEDILEENQD